MTSETEVTPYRMNPAEDDILFGDELREGMWVLTESARSRQPGGADGDSRIRAQRFRRVTRLRRESGACGNPGKTIFVGEWVDGYKEVHSYAVTYGWIVKRDVPEEDAAAKAAGTEAVQ